MERKRIGIITKPQALKGEFRVKPDLLNLKKYKTIKVAYVKNTEYEVERVTLRDTFVIFKLKGIDTCESAESLRNTEIFADMAEEKVDEHDYEGYGVFVENSYLGTITEINNYGSKDIWSVEGDKNLMLPYIEGLVLSCDDTQRKIILNEEKFNQVAVYED